MVFYKIKKKEKLQYNLSTNIFTMIFDKGFSFNKTKTSFLKVHNIIKSLLLEKLLCCDVDIALHLFVADTSLNTGEIDTLNY